MSMRQIIRPMSRRIWPLRLSNFMSAEIKSAGKKSSKPTAA